MNESMKTGSSVYLSLLIACIHDEAPKASERIPDPERRVRDSSRRLTSIVVKPSDCFQ